MSPVTRGRVGIGSSSVSVALLVLTSALGPSAASKRLPSGGALPPWSSSGRPSAELVTALLLLATGAGVAGLLLTWRALREGWAPSWRRLLALCAICTAALAVVPPVTNDDVTSYAAYGRLATQGRNPYATRPVDLDPDDPYRALVGATWERSRSVYGPLATAEHWAAARIAGDEPRTAVALLHAMGALAFLLSVLVLLAGVGSAARRRWVLAVYGLNPLVLMQVVAGSHVDSLLLLATAAAVVLVARRPAVAGAFAGAAVAVKLSGGLALVGLGGWLLLRHRRSAAVAFAVSALAVVIPSYVLAGGWGATEQARRASRFVSVATPWRWLAEPLDAALGMRASRLVLAGVALAVVAALVPIVRRLLPRPLGAEPAALPAALTIAWLLGSIYLLPWYDSWGWLLLALLPWCAAHRVLLAHTAILVVAYLPGRAIALPPVMGTIARWWREGVSPALLLVLLCWVVLRSRRAREGSALAELGERTG